MKIGIVVSEYNASITEALLAGSTGRLKEQGIAAEHIHIVKVPGAVEIPLTAKLMAKSGKFDAVICHGAVIRGDTDHYDYVCKQVSDGCQQVMMEFNLPVVFGVLTTNNMEQALERVGGKHGHKGVEAADAALTMIGIVKNLAALS